MAYTVYSMTKNNFLKDTRYYIFLPIENAFKFLMVFKHRAIIQKIV